MDTTRISYFLPQINLPLRRVFQSQALLFNQLLFHKPLRPFQSQQPVPQALSTALVHTELHVEDAKKGLCSQLSAPGPNANPRGSSPGKGTSTNTAANTPNRSNAPSCWPTWVARQRGSRRTRASGGTAGFHIATMLRKMIFRRWMQNAMSVGGHRGRTI
jgi:hypothetical protein